MTKGESRQKAVLVSSDGDYAGLVKFLLEKDKFLAVVSPAVAIKCSILLKRTGAKISYLNDQKSILRAQKRKSPRCGQNRIRVFFMVILL